MSTTSSTQPESGIFYTLHESAQKLCRSTKTVQRLIADGLLRRDPTSRRVLIPRQDVDNFFERQGKIIAPASTKKAGAKT